jgi:hypothetical protein
LSACRGRPYLKHKYRVCLVQNELLMMAWCCCCRKKSKNKADDDTDASEPLIKTADGYGDSDESMDSDEIKAPRLEKQRTIGDMVDVSERSISDLHGIPELAQNPEKAILNAVGSFHITELLEEQEHTLNMEGVVSKLEKPEVTKKVSWDLKDDDA